MGLAGRIGLLAAVVVSQFAAAAGRDWRNLETGTVIPDEGYCDQPYVVITKDGNWLCTLTTGKGVEGQPGQHICATISSDKGKTWSPLIDIEPADGPEASWVMPLIIPSGRVYVFYDYNGDRVSRLGDKEGIRADMLGWYVYKWSDDNGRTWSKDRVRLPVRQTPLDDANDFGGKVQILWGVGKPIIVPGVSGAGGTAAPQGKAENGTGETASPQNKTQSGAGGTAAPQEKAESGAGKAQDEPGGLSPRGRSNADNLGSPENARVYFGFSKIGRYLIDHTEGWFFASDDILTVTDPAAAGWRMLPEGDVGLRSPNGTVAEEQNLVALSDGGLYAVYRTVEGHPCHSYSRDGGRTWSGPEYASYTPGGRLIKHPRACCKIWKCLNGKYLMWFHNHGGKSFEGRNPVWVLGGVERDGYMHWSQPEILLYDPKADNRISYPDLIEQDGRYWITETQKTIARVHEVDASLLEGLWNQGQARGPAPAGPAGEGMTIEAAFTTDRLGLSGVLADARKEGQGAVLELTAAGTARLTITAQGHEPFSWESDQGLLTPGRRHQVAVIADEASRIVMFVVDGQLCDGGTQRPNGWTRLPEGMSVPLPVDQAEAGSAKGLSVERARLFKRPLRVSEVAGAIAN